MKKIMIALALMLAAGVAQADLAAPNSGVIINEHGGGLDSNGCHHNRKTGGYHCH